VGELTGTLHVVWSGTASRARGLERSKSGTYRLGTSSSPLPRTFLSGKQTPRHTPRLTAAAAAPPSLP